MFTITKTFEFSAAHWLTGVPEDHPCARNHGHNYLITIKLKSDIVGPDGFVIDFNELDCVKQWLDAKFDHRALNDELENPTSELLAQYIARACPWGNPNIPYVLLESVEVKETWKTSATWSRW